MKVKKKPGAIDARGPLTESELVTTAHGRVRAEPGDYVLKDPKTNDEWPIKPDIYKHTYEPARGEPTDIEIRVKEDTPEEGNGIRFYIVVRVDSGSFAAATMKDARNFIRREFAFALEALMKVVEQEHKKLTTEMVKEAQSRG